MIELLEQYIVSLFLTTLFVWGPLYFIFQYPIMKYYKEDESMVNIDNGESKKKAENISIITSILFLSAVSLFLYRCK